MLEQQIAKEKDVSVRSLLKEILNKSDEISELREQIAQIENRLPRPHIAQKGESHYQIALAFLVSEKGLEEEQAQKLLKRTALFDQLAEGFKVWNFYNGDEYGTSVTQGEAQFSPNVFVHRAKKKLMDDRDKALSERDQLAEDIKCVQEKQVVADAQLGQVTREKENLAIQVVNLNRRVNSVYYRLDSLKTLKKKGILKSGFLSSAKIKDISSEHFNQSIDLNSSNELVISAEDLGIKKIKDVVLFPRFYKKVPTTKSSLHPTENTPC